MATSDAKKDTDAWIKSTAEEQRELIAAARQAGLDAEVRRMGETLRLYESGRPSRTPWSADPTMAAGRR